MDSATTPSRRGAKRSAEDEAPSLTVAEPNGHSAELAETKNMLEERPNKSVRLAGDETAASPILKNSALPTLASPPVQVDEARHSPASMDRIDQRQLDRFSSILRDFEVFLFDIEGTVCPIAFVKEVLFPYALEALPKVLDEQWNDNKLAEYRKAFPETCRDDRRLFEQHVHHLTSEDIKAPYLKALQGYLWKHGYDSGELKAPLFADVAPFMKAAHDLGKKMIIYSSGSVAAQKLLFGHTNADPSNLQPLISDWFDTVNAGKKTESLSYANIISAHDAVEPAKWLFFSDNLHEVAAAREAGMQSLPVARPGNPPMARDSPLARCAILDFSAHEVDQGLTAAAKPITALGAK